MCFTFHEIYRTSFNTSQNKLENGFLTAVAATVIEKLSPKTGLITGTKLVGARKETVNFELLLFFTIKSCSYNFSIINTFFVRMFYGSSDPHKLGSVSKVFHIELLLHLEVKVTFPV
jgi:hypothetical protein